MGSIIDDIHGVERIVEDIKAEGRREIQRIYDAQAKKITEMQNYFADNFAKDAEALEQSLNARVAQYEEQLKNNFPDRSAALKKILDARKGEILDMLAREFWRK